MDFNPCAYPHRDGIEMRDGLGELKGFTLRVTDYHGYTFHEAYARFGDKVRYVGDHADVWTAYGMIETYYSTQDYYGDYYSPNSDFVTEQEMFRDHTQFIAH
ncbi:hypothetical protein [Nonomuraea candida]|uniref:hypothetical protein n=1 Tax=Nonomuraea candida TaxID=359159 RepID=UPI0005B935CB|nr:hypothetical protein [Nonomuraea candida]